MWFRCLIIVVGFFKINLLRIYFSFELVYSDIMVLLPKGRGYRNFPYASKYFVWEVGSSIKILSFFFNRNLKN